MKIIIIMSMMLFVSLAGAATEVYFNPADTDVLGHTNTTIEVRVNASDEEHVSSVNSYIVYDPDFIKIMNVECDPDSGWWLPVQPMYLWGKVYFSTCTWTPETCDAHILNLTVECGGVESSSPLNFTDDGNGEGQGVHGPNVTYPDVYNTTWTNATINCEGDRRTEVYFNHDQCIAEHETTIVEVRFNTTSEDPINNINSYVVYDPDVVNITAIEYDMDLWNIHTITEYNTGNIYFSCADGTKFTNDTHVVNLTIQGNESGVSQLHFAGGYEKRIDVSGGYISSPSAQWPYTHNHAVWTDSSIRCVGCGDVDSNGHVSANDVVETYYRAVDPEYPLQSEWTADVDCSGMISATDVVEIYLTAVDPDHRLNCCNS